MFIVKATQSVLFCYSSLYGLGHKELNPAPQAGIYTQPFLQVLAILIKSPSPQLSPNFHNCSLLSLTILNTFFVAGIAKIVEQSCKNVLIGFITNLCTLTSVGSPN